MFQHPLAVFEFLLAVAVSCNCLSEASASERIDFNRDIRPILSENCFYCHGQDPNHREAGLRLDIREAAIAAGAFHGNEESGSSESGSSLLERVLSDDVDMRMPPPESNRILSDDQRDLLKRWIEQGAPYAEHWAFVAPQRPPIPEVNGSQWPRNPIDSFVLSKLESRRFAHSPEAEKATLIKRLFSDLIGLPPTPDQILQFLNDDSPNAYEKVVDDLLKSEHYGERMALPWLDAARYADSNGFQQDGDTWQWMWRDWVISALNTNLPFDQFVTWQLAGDLLPDATVPQMIASGFNRNHMLNGEGGAIPEEQRFNILFDRMDTTATVFLGLTLSCAQCHDHKYDPLTQHDYYSLMDAFNRVPETGTPQYYSTRIRVALPVIEVPSPEVISKIAEYDSQIQELEMQLTPLLDAALEGWKVAIHASSNLDGQQLSTGLKGLLAKPEGERSDEEKAKLESDLASHFSRKIRPALQDKIPVIAAIRKLQEQKTQYVNDQMPRPMVMSDDGARETNILIRGEYLKPGEKVEFTTPATLPPFPEDFPKNRLGLAAWLLMPEQPLTARVHVNRIWQQFFGTGIVKTVEDFGVQSEYPLHMDLLDWLAVEFREKGWDMKGLTRLIVTSATYRQSSRISPEHYHADPENRLYGRFPRMRMPAMVLRDWALAASQALEPQIGGKPVYPYQPDDIWESLAITKERDFTYPASQDSDLFRRSVYTFWRRTVGPANMFDSSNRQTCRVRTTITSTPLHALTTLNDPTWVEASRLLAAQVAEEHDVLEQQIDQAFLRVLCRLPNEFERKQLLSAFKKQYAIFESAPDSAVELLRVGTKHVASGSNPVHQAALTAVCLGIFNLDEAFTRE